MVLRASLGMKDLFGGLRYFLFLFYMYERLAYIYECTPHAYLVPAEARRRCKIPWKGSYTDDWELPCKCWELNLGPLQE